MIALWGQDVCILFCEILRYDGPGIDASDVEINFMPADRDMA